MALFRRFFYRKPPDRLLEITDRAYVFDSCFSTDLLNEDEYKIYLGGIVSQLQDHYPDASFMVFNFREGTKQSQISDILSQYDMTVMDYPRQYEGCPLLPLEMIHHFLLSSETWLSLEEQQNVLLMHCERGGWPVLAFMLAALLLYKKLYKDEQKTHEMIYKRAPRELLRLLSPLNPQPSQLRYLQYISGRNTFSDWPPSDSPLSLDCVILRFLPLFDGGRGCGPLVRLYGQDPVSTTSIRSPKLLFSTLKTKENSCLYRQEKCALVKIDIHQIVQGDVVLECFHLENDFVREEIIFRVMFHTAFIRSNVLTLNRDEVDVLWDAKDLFHEGFRAEVLFSNADAVPSIITTGMESVYGPETKNTSPEEMFEVEEIFSNAVDAKVHDVAQISSLGMSLAGASDIGEMVVSLTDQEEAIICRLMRGSSQRDIVSIVGMPGIGKTTLAKKVYNDPKIAYHFHRRAWCSVSQVYGKRELLLDIIKDVHGLPDEIHQMTDADVELHFRRIHQMTHQMTDADLELHLRRKLKEIRYLIVMDDVWDIQAFNDLERSFPDDGEGSRILITSRFHNVALETKPDSNPHMLRPLSEDESWKLLEMKSFAKVGSCPKELVEIGKEIARQCEGLALAVVSIAGILKRTKNKQDHWENIAKSLSSQIIADPETRCKFILELSYMHLPCHLKACFLYFGALSEDKDVPVSKLIRLWIAEGFIEKNEAESLEDTAEDYLMDLINRSLVMISKRRSNGRVKACCVHGLFRYLCLSKAQEENFLQLITRYDEPYASFDLWDYGSGVYDFYPSNPVTYECQRLRIHLKRKHFVYSRPSGPCTSSLIFSACSDTYPRRSYNVSFICHQSKLLKVLDLECINMGTSLPPEIELLVQLRYLAVSGDMESIPASIANLVLLETFIVKGLSGKVVLPDTIWCMTSLRHLHVNSYAVFNLQDEKIGSSFELDNLVSLSLPSLSHGKDVEKILGRLPNLQKLTCVFLESWDSTMNCNQFPRLDCLTKLDSLEIVYFGRALNPAVFTFPLSLKKLTLSNFHLPWNQICAIGRLPNLEVLKLLFGAFEGLMWEMREDEFCKLKFLKLDTLNIVEWNASYEHLPELQQLVLRNCKNLEEVPVEFAGIPTLQKIEVQGCKRSVEVSVREIEEQTEGIKVIIS